MKGKVTGIGGIYFRAEDSSKLKAWYEKHLGVKDIFYWKEKSDSETMAFTVWNPVAPTSSLFEDTDKSFYFSYRVDSIGLLLAQMKDAKALAGVSITDDENGTYASLKDPEGNKIVLWESLGNVTNSTTATPHRVSGIGGLFFKSADPKALRAWYGENLGFDVSDWGCSFEWIDPNDPSEPAQTAWNPFKADTDYFLPSKKQWMLNYRVTNLEQLIKSLKEEGVQIIGEVEDSPYGKFGRAMDPEGNKMELWEAAHEA